MTTTVQLGARRWNLTIGARDQLGGVLLYSSDNKKAYLFDGHQLIGYRRTPEGVRTYHWAISNLEEVRAAVRKATRLRLAA